MRRFQKLLSVGLLALAPAAVMAGPFDGAASGKSAGQPAARSAASKKMAQDQELAQRVANALQKAKLTSHGVRVDAHNGVVTLDGAVSTPEQRKAANKICGSIKGVSGVNNRLQIDGPAPVPVGSPIRQAGYQPGPAGRPMVQQVADVGGTPGQMLAQSPSAPMAMPAYGQPDVMGGHTIYNQPNLPNYSWPTYAQYPNYAAVTYPSQYAPSAWPYIGPFYPYPQVPLNWRKATLEWKEGNWNLSFDSKFNRWCWFLDPKEW
ncbi:MAG: BON domain-containing protein [Planctomycetes bacterium]|nr:BON domain-containing protein [Planctomycetota bacterium]